MSRATKAIEEARSLQAINHSGLKGELREMVVRELLEPLIPPGCVVGSGEIVSAYEGTSNQIDIVVADRRILPPLLIREAGVFPLEACLLTLEIKSTLNASELRASHDSAKRLARFHHAPPVARKERADSIEHIIPFLLAFDSDLAQGGKSEVDRYLEMTANDHPAILGICVIGRGYWHWSGHEWKNRTLPIAHGDLLGLIGEIINIAQRVAQTRRQPDIREYLCWGHAVSDKS